MPSTTTTYETIHARRLTPDQVATWTALIPRTGDFASPFFRPEYTQAVAAVRDAIEVCVITRGRETIGFLPFERLESTVGRPVGGSMSNFQGVIAAPDGPWTAVDLARGARLKTLKFHHQVRDQPQFDAHTERRVASPIVDVGGGWDGYLEQRRIAGVSSFNALPRKMRKLERELGALRFVSHTAEPDVFARLVEWKRAQYVRTETRGSMQHEWALEILRRLMEFQSSAFAGTLSALYAGERLIAAHAGMRSATVWHYWYPAYDPELSRHSPGLVLMHEMCRWAAGTGLHRIDLGPGEGAHKDLFATSETSVGVGQVVVSSPASLLSRLTSRLGFA
jgi:CelD/BcsL family acetyltransferase involved in cellulose biosynthesis